MTGGRGALGPSTSLIAAAALLVLVMAASIVFGTEPVSLARAVADPGLDRVILFDVRAPRVLLAALAGGALSAVGASYQALLRNPLAEPFVPPPARCSPAKRRPRPRPGRDRSRRSASCESPGRGP